ncbi:MAG TPA: vitamin K epoxide reductase family protein [Miltoncostaeaceae bacterium]|nr:vitamin K epoxide reductase family protein [Miltoncostaeaceae bacterium]
MSGRVGLEGVLRIALAVVAVLGLGVATYLTVVRFSGGNPFCVVGGGCEVVQKSEYATLVGIPVPVLGLLGYTGFLVAAALPGPPGRALGLFNGLVAFGFSAWLTSVEAFILHSWCAWCVTSAVLVTIATALCVARMVVGARADAVDADEGSGIDGDDPAPGRA